MQFKKPFISGLLAITLLANLFMPAFAYNSTGSTTDRVTGEDTAQNVNTEYQETNNTSSETQVYATRSSTFTVLVPKAIILSGSTGLGQYVVGAKGDVLAEDSITIEPDSYSLTLYRVDNHTKETPASVTQGTTSVTGAQIADVSPAYATMEGSIQANGLKAGSWSTTMRFNIALNEETTKPFTVTADNKTELGVTDTTTNLDIPSNFVDSNGDNREVVGIDNNAFYDNNNLEKVTIPGSVESIGDNAFADCDNLGRVEVADEVQNIGNNAFGGVDEVIYGGNATGSPWGANNVYASIDAIPSHVHTLEHVARVEATEEAAGNIEYWHCTDCDKYYRDAGCTDEITLADTIIPKIIHVHNLTYLQDVNCWHCDECDKYFSDENGANEIMVQDFIVTSENRGKIGYQDIENEEFIIPTVFRDKENDTLYKVTGIGERAFSNCFHLKTIKIPNTVTSIGSYAFSYGNLESIEIPNSVTIIEDYVFHDSNNLKSVIIPDSIISIGQNAFYSCEGLTSVIIPDSVKTIGKSAFFGCTSLDSLTIGNSVEIIGHSAFNECTGLTSITIPDSVTSIEGFAFQECNSLESVTIPNSVISIGNYVFSLCPALKAINWNGNVYSSNGYFVKAWNEAHGTSIK